jgi:hypothetical protein
MQKANSLLANYPGDTKMQGEQRSVLFCSAGFALKKGDSAVQVQE